MTDEYIFRIGDYITLDKNLKDYKWYTDEVFRVINIIGDVLILDGNLPEAKENYFHNRLHSSKAVLDIKKSRSEKLKIIFE